MPLISIGLPVYNSEKYVEESILAILNQTYEDFELIISDNASTDNTRRICEKYSKIEKRVKYYRNHSNIGIGKNFSRVFKLSIGKYFRWHTSDDICGASLIERCLEVLERDESVALCYPKTVLIDEVGNEIEKYEDNLNLFSNDPRKRFIEVIKNLRLCNIQYGLLRSGLMKKTSLFETFTGSDKLFISQMALLGKFVEIPEYLFFRRLHSESSYGIKDMDEVIKYYDPISPCFYPNSKILQRYMETVFLSKLRVSGKIALIKFLIIGAIHSRDKYYKEFTFLLRNLFGNKSL